jgi:hypothetical protein
MIWDEVVEKVIAALDADELLTAALEGGTVEMAESVMPREVPSIRLTVVDDREGEVLETILLQVSFWGRSRENAVAIERRVRRVLHADTRRDFDGIEMATLFVEGRDMDDPEPGVVARSLDFRFEPVRRRFDVPDEN